MAKLTRLLPERPVLYPIHRWQAFAELTVDEEDALRSLAQTVKAYKPGETIRHEGDAVTGLYLHIEGWVTSSVLLPSGGRLIQKVHLPGDVLGAPSMALTHAADTLTTITAAAAAFVPFDQINSIFSRLPRLAALFIIAAQAERLALIDTLVVKGRAFAREQLAYLLLDLHARLYPLGAVMNGTFDFPLTQPVIGDIIGLSSIHVNRTMSQLRREGIVAQEGRRLTILDLEALQAISPIQERQLQFAPPWMPR